jgi:GntR family transcriptional regulator
MELDLDPRSPVALYRQIVDRMRRAIALGALRAGDRLPTVRELAVLARVNRNTAARAIQELERAGLVRTRVGQGTFVTDGHPAIDPAVRDRRVADAIDRLLVEARSVGMSLDDVRWRVDAAISALDGGEPAGEEETS